MSRPTGRPGAVLFACNFNRVRSPMAEGLMRAFYGDAIFVDSCGLRPEAHLDPLAQQVMAEVGVDISDHRSKSFEDLACDSFDLIISFTAESQARAAVQARACAVEVEHWPLADPTQAEGSREAVLEAYRQVRDDLRDKLVRRFGPPLVHGAPSR
jgi:protein-tyrosine-phosphatase